jgi:hypothetical protein
MGKLRGLAGELGYELVKAPIRGCWFLVDESGVQAVSDRGTTAFGVEAAIKFLKASANLSARPRAGAAAKRERQSRPR